MPIDILLQEAKGLSDEALMEVVRFVRFMKTESAGTTPLTASADGKKQKLRSAGKYRGKGWMADDFDAPMIDFKEYM